MGKLHGLFFSVVLCWSAASIPASCGQEAASIRYPRVPQGVILSLSGKHYPAIARALSTVGIQVRESLRRIADHWRENSPFS